MSKLRFLYLKYVALTGNFEQTFENLRWLCWEFCSLKCLPFDFYAEKLVILELLFSEIRTAWEPNMVGHSERFSSINEIIFKVYFISSNCNHFTGSTGF